MIADYRDVDVDMGDHDVCWHEGCGWNLAWRFGGMRLRWPYPDDREGAEAVARLFAWLYLKGVDCGLARDLASDHVYVASGRHMEHVAREVAEAKGGPVT